MGAPVRSGRPGPPRSRRGGRSSRARSTPSRERSAPARRRSSNAPGLGLRAPPAGRNSRRGVPNPRSAGPGSRRGAPASRGPSARPSRDASVVEGVERERQAPRQRRRERLAPGAERPQVLGHARTKIRLELREETEIAEPLLLREQQVDPLGERRARAQVRPPLLADPLRLCRRAEPREGGVEPGLVEAEARGGRGARASGGAERMQELVVLAVLERRARGRGDRGARRGRPPRARRRRDRASRRGAPRGSRRGGHRAAAGTARGPPALRRGAGRRARAARAAAPGGATTRSRARWTTMPAAFAFLLRPRPALLPRGGGATAPERKARPARPPPPADSAPRALGRRPRRRASRGPCRRARAARAAVAGGGSARIARAARSSSQDSGERAARISRVPAWRPASAHQRATRSSSSASISAMAGRNVRRAAARVKHRRRSRLPLVRVRGSLPRMSPGTKDGGIGRTPAAVRSLRWILFALLFTSAALTLVGVPELARSVAVRRAGRAPRSPSLSRSSPCSSPVTPRTGSCSCGRGGTRRARRSCRWR